MIEMDEQFQREFGAAMAQLRALHQNFVRSAQHARDEARSIAVAEEPAAAIPAYEISHACWSAAEGLRPVLGSFEDADRRAAQLMATAAPEVSMAEPAYQERVKYLEGQLARLDGALRGRAAALGEKFHESENTEGLIDAAIFRMVEDRPERMRGSEREQALAEVTTAAAKLLGVVTLPEIIPALRKALGKFEGPLETMADGTLIAGQWVGSNLPGRKVYVGRFAGTVNWGTESPAVKLQRICTQCDRHGDTAHVVTTLLAPSTVRLPEADEILEFSALSEAHGLLELDIE